MLDVSKLKKKLEKLSKGIKRKAIIVTTSSLIALSSFLNTPAMAEFSQKSVEELKEAISLVGEESGKVYLKNEDRFKMHITRALESISKDIKKDIEEGRFFDSIATLKNLVSILEIFKMGKELSHLFKRVKKKK